MGLSKRVHYGKEMVNFRPFFFPDTDDLFQANPLSIADLGGIDKNPVDNFYKNNRELI